MPTTPHTIDFPPEDPVPSTLEQPPLVVEDGFDYLQTNQLADMGDTPWHKAGMSVSIFQKTGLHSAPLASAPGAVRAFWRAHSDCAIKVITFVVQRLEAIPTCPHVDTGDANDVLITRMLSMGMPEVLPDGSRLFTVVGAYWYDMQKCPGLNEPLNMPSSMLLFQPTQVVLDPDTFDRIVAKSQSPAGFTGGPINF